MMESLKVVQILIVLSPYCQKRLKYGTGHHILDMNGFKK